MRKLHRNGILIVAAALSCSPLRAQPAFQHFFAGDMGKKTIVVWGNSTVAFEDGFFQTLAAQGRPRRSAGRDDGDS